MLSKSRGLIVRLAAVLHVLFSIFPNKKDIETSDEEGTPLTTVISEEAVIAAIDFVCMSCQQTTFCAGHGTLEEEVMKFTPSKY